MTAYAEHRYNEDIRRLERRIETLRSGLSEAERALKAMREAKDAVISYYSVLESVRLASPISPPANLQR